MRISIFGTGYVGLVTGVCLADLGNDVLCVDVDTAKIALLERGGTPIYEPGLKERMDRSVKEGRLRFTADMAAAVRWGDILFICVGTPPQKDGSVDIKHVEQVAASIGKHLDGEKLIVDKSTVPVGTAEMVRGVIEAELRRRKTKRRFHVVSNPEFLREGAAVNDFFNPDRVVVGLEEGDSFAREAMDKLYRGVARTTRPILFTDTRSAELIKYASNAMLATRISFMNQLSQYCELVGADITAVSRGLGLDTRIGSRFLHAGVGYGGSCFPKDVKGLIASIKAVGGDGSIFEAVHAANEAQKRSLFPKMEALLGKPLKEKRVAVWGLSFKPRTDDTREAPSHVVVEWLLSKGASVSAFDPEAMTNFRKEHEGIGYSENPYGVLKGADLLILLTEWDEFRNPDWERIKKLMRRPAVLDGRNIYLGYRDDLKRLGFRYIGVGVKGV